MFGIKRLFRRAANLIRCGRGTLANYRILSSGFGQFKSMRKQQCVDREGNYLPWYTYPAIEYIKQLDLTDKTVWEYGSGYSTLFWAARVKQVVAIEDDKNWYERLKPLMPPNVRYVLTTSRQDYVNAIAKHESKFDIIVNDGIYRLDCAMAARDKLADGGFIILDNSDWCAKTSAFYRDCDLIEVDMSGFGPINTYAWATSFYFTRTVRLKPAHDRQPAYGVGSQIITDKEMAEWIQG